MFTFNYKNINSKDLGYFVESIPIIPSFVDGDNNITISFAYKIEDIEEQILLIKRLFQSTTGELVLDICNNYYFNVTNCSAKERERNKSYVIVDATFQLDPYFYHKTGGNVELLTSNKILNNPCTGGKPLIKIFPNADNGSFILKLNSKKTTLTNLKNNKYIIIDSELNECYSESGFENNFMDGPWPEWQEYSNTVDFIGQVSKIEIIPRWRS